jgi:hypothetical protein
MSTTSTTMMKVGVKIEVGGIQGKERERGYRGENA